MGEASKVMVDVVEENKRYNWANRRNRNWPDPWTISDEVWETAEETAWKEVVTCIHATRNSDELRMNIIDYLQRIFRFYLGIQVFPYGSVPLKTYLPDGDIDLTALTSPNNKDTLPRYVFEVLTREQTNENARYQVRNTQFVDAEVKLVKCLVEGIVIDISFNQLGGISSLCFLEQVDRLVRKEHLFKRSIILIKSWCYYESHILGSHNGLMSTYALEILILCIFLQFHSSLNGPVAALYRFLDYYSKIDWENCCIGLNGPVNPSSPCDAEGDGGASSMFHEEIGKCKDMFTVSSAALETNSQAFTMKHLNIIDPLKENNNLGRSVHKANFYRIVGAFKYGARRLGSILSLPKDRIADEIKNFFQVTLEMHGGKTATFSFDSRTGSLSTLESDVDDSSSSENMSAVEGTINSEVRYGPSEDPHEGHSSHPVIFRFPRLRCTHKAFRYLQPDRDFNDSCLTAGASSLSSTYNQDDESANDLLNLSLDEDDDSDCSSLVFKETNLSSIIEEKLNLSDLRGDYDSYIRSLVYGKCCLAYGSSKPGLNSLLPSSPSLIPRKDLCDDFHPYVPMRWHIIDTNGAVFELPHYLADIYMSRSAAFDVDERHQAHGAVTYFEDTDGTVHCEVALEGIMMNQAQETNSQLPQRPLNHASLPFYPRRNYYEEGGRQVAQEQSTVMQRGMPYNAYHQPMHLGMGNPHGDATQPIQFGSFGTFPASSSQLAFGNSYGGASTSGTAETQDKWEVKKKNESSLPEKCR